ncbi:tetratricopeptide repeat protein [Aromatoleum diolicum]|uniref:Sel1 repeat family protein n=1 Tax=Aromatoleum diolicum TaxID=75796 RepID=A0ABX1QBG6_9RHOO|nr:tetratricopeptide repeat protein [Aromatoleum diolicum]NMG74455.1 sel1 repeat family protein [Aromatoleum diolicum]
MLKIGPKLVATVALGAMLGSTHAQDSSAGDWIKNPGMGNYKAYAEFKMANYAAARHIWEILAGLGNADALFNLGILAEDGLGEDKDMKKAQGLYVAAANAGGFKAQYRLGMLYSQDGAVPKDIDKARHYLSLAAQSGDKEAAARLASLAQPDRPLTEFEQAENLSSTGKHAEAATLYRRAADTGNVTARTRLAWMYEAGRGVERNLDEAARLFMRSAEDGDAEAQYAIAVMYRTGKGQPQDIDQSVSWLKRAAAQNYPPAQAALAAEDGSR